MAHENLELVRRSVLEFNQLMAGELSIDEWAERFDAEVELRWADQQTYPDAPQQIRGIADTIAFTEEYRRGWADLVGELLELAEGTEGRVMGFTRQTARGRQSGVPIEVHYFQVWTIRDGKVRSIEYFRHRADALEAAGLAE